MKYKFSKKDIDKCFKIFEYVIASVDKFTSSCMLRLDIKYPYSASRAVGTIELSRAIFRNNYTTESLAATYKMNSGCLDEYSCPNAPCFLANEVFKLIVEYLNAENMTNIIPHIDGYTIYLIAKEEITDINIVGFGKKKYRIHIFFKQHAGVYFDIFKEDFYKSFPEYVYRHCQNLQHKIRDYNDQIQELTKKRDAVKEELEKFSDEDQLKAELT